MAEKNPGRLHQNTHGSHPPPSSTPACKPAGRIRPRSPGTNFTPQQASSNHSHPTTTPLISFSRRPSYPASRRAPTTPSPPAATLLAHLAIPITRDWSHPQAISTYRVADYACGPGALLTAAYRRIEELREASGAPHQSLTHNHLLTTTLTGCDIYPANTALAADNLVSMNPAPTRTTRIYTLRYGPLNPYGPSPRSHQPGSTGPAPT